MLGEEVFGGGEDAGFSRLLARGQGWRGCDLVDLGAEDAGVDFHFKTLAWVTGCVNAGVMRWGIFVCLVDGSPKRDSSYESIVLVQDAAVFVGRDRVIGDVGVQHGPLGFRGGMLWGVACRLLRSGAGRGACSGGGRFLARFGSLGGRRGLGVFRLGGGGARIGG